MGTKKKRNQSEPKKMKTYTKRWVTALLVIAVIDMQLPFILAFFDKAAIAESLAMAIVTEIVAVILGYMLKSYFETKQEKKMEYYNRKLNHDEEDEQD